MMKRQWILCVAIALAGTVMAPQRAMAEQGSALAKCARACVSCQKACQACAVHCAGMVKAGNKKHVTMMHLAEDCMDLCTLCGRLCDRRGPMAPTVARACEVACDACGAECKKFPDMAVMAACAKSCEECAYACRNVTAK